MDILLNRWLLYQTLASRVWARSAFYQSSGAYGFRDQIQDIMALAPCQNRTSRGSTCSEPRRGSLMRGTFSTGGCLCPVMASVPVFPTTGSGCRIATAHYVKTTGDRSILDQQVPFIEGPTLQAGEHEAFFQPMISEDSASLLRALRPGAGPKPRRWGAWPAANRHRRLE